MGKQDKDKTSDEMRIRLPKGLKEWLREVSDEVGITMNSTVILALREKKMREEQNGNHVS